MAKAEGELAEKMKKAVAGKGTPPAGEGTPAPAGTKPPVLTEPTPEEKHKTELTAQLKTANPGKTDEEIGTLLTTKLGEEKTQRENLQTKTAEIKGRPENKDKTDAEISAILKTELLKPPVPAAPAKSFNELLKEATKGTFADINELVNKANEPRLKFANDQIKHLNDLAEKGADITNILKFQSLGIEKLEPTDIENAKELLKHEMRLNEPGITEKELEYELNTKYDLTLKKNEEEEVTNANEVEMAKLRLIRNSRAAKDKLLKLQKDSELPKSTNGLTTEQTDILKRQWAERVDSSLKEFNELEFEIGDKKIKYTPDKEQLKATMLEPDRFLSRYRNNGSTDMEKFRHDMVELNESAKIRKVIYEQAKSDGYEQAINDISNLSVEPTGSPATASEAKTPAQYIAKKHAAAIGGF